MDNIEIQLRHIHIRYEDSSTFPGETFSCGCTLESFVVTTTDQEWTETFVNRSKKKDNKAKSMSFKLAKSTNFGVYWNMQSPEFGPFEYDEWKTIMKQCVASDPPSVPVIVVDQSPVKKKKNDKVSLITLPEEITPVYVKPELTYIIKPSNFGQLKITHDESQDVVPQVAIRFESSDLKLHFDKLQMRQSMKAMLTMQAMREKMHLLVLRPSRSAMEQPWEWWAYMLILIAKKPDLMEKKVGY